MTSRKLSVVAQSWKLIDDEVKESVHMANLDMIALYWFLWAIQTIATNICNRKKTFEVSGTILGFNGEVPPLKGNLLVSAYFPLLRLVISRYFTDYLLLVLANPASNCTLKSCSSFNVYPTKISRPLSQNCLMIQHIIITQNFFNPHNNCNIFAKWFHQKTNNSITQGCPYMIGDDDEVQVLCFKAPARLPNRKIKPVE